jgi:hypothetical protein
MIIKKITDTSGISTSKLHCSHCRIATAEVMWLGLEVEVHTSPKVEWANAAIYFCEKCASEICLGLLYDLAELKQREGNNAPMEAWNNLVKVFKPTAS